jgi:hypothetical protein
MKRMLCTLSICLAIARPALVAAPQQSDAAAYTGARAASVVADTCGATETETANPEYLWRLRADRELKCVIDIIDKALQASGDAVMLSREDAERVRMLAFRAKDAAARIGR